MPVDGALLKTGVKVGGWEIIEKLGAGGQGSVFLVRSPSQVAEIEKTKRALRRAFQASTAGTRGSAEDSDKNLAELVASIGGLLKEEGSDSRGALKVFDFAGPHGHAAGERLQREVDVLEKSNDPAVIQLRASDAKEGWMVTAYQSGGTLDRARGEYKGDVVRSLRALVPIAKALAAFHLHGTVHRDIKPHNIFVRDDRGLVLGDFGIVFYADEHGRLTRTFERVGPYDWMAPWANVAKRLEDPNPTFDVFPLAKVLWSMISGQLTLPYWYYDHDDYNLERLFPGDPAMAAVNERIFSKSIVQFEKDCMNTCAELLAALQQTLQMLDHGGETLIEGQPRPCHVCGSGYYQLLWKEDVLNERFTYQLAVLRMRAHNVPDEGQALTIHTYRCTECGHLQFFNYAGGRRPSIWIRR